MALTKRHQKAYQLRTLEEPTKGIFVKQGPLEDILEAIQEGAAHFNEVEGLVTFTKILFWSAQTKTCGSV